MSGLWLPPRSTSTKSLWLPQEGLAPIVRHADHDAFEMSLSGTNLFQDEMEFFHFITSVLLLMNVFLIAMALYIKWCRFAWKQQFHKRPTRDEIGAPSNSDRPRVRVRNESEVPGSYALDMDHLRLPFSTYMILLFLVGPNSIYLWVKGTLVLKVREYLCEKGIIRPAQGYDPRKVAADLLLEGVGCVLHYTGKDIDNVATFDFHEFPVFLKDKPQVITKHLTVRVDLKTKRMVAATLNGRYLNPHDTVCLLWFASTTSDHVKVHALANWAHPDQSFTTEESRSAQSPTPAKEQKQTSSGRFHQRMSNISILYNYFGVSFFPKICSLWYGLGLTSQDMSTSISGIFKEGLDSGIGYHANITELLPYSSIVRFVFRFRIKFLKRFQQHVCEHPQDFPRVDGESMFVSTVLHSLDHKLMEWNLKDPLWLDYSNISEEYHPLVDIGRLIRNGFMEDLPGVIFARKYKDVKLPFYEQVYRDAVLIDERLANEMDAFIIK